jgi:hypothetical protein
MAEQVIKLHALEIEEAITAIQMRICFIETGCTHMSAADAHEYNRSLRRTLNDPLSKSRGLYAVQVSRPMNINVLETSQVSLIGILKGTILRLQGRCG